MNLNQIQRAGLIAALLIGLPCALHAQKNVVQPGDPIIASSANSPGSEGVANAIDGQPTKYLNRDLANDAKPAGFVVSPSVGLTRVTGMSLMSANDAADRDPKKLTLEGSNDDTVTDFNSGNWTTIVTLDIPSWPSVFGPTDAENRYKTQTFEFDNFKAYKHYRWTVLNTQGPSTCCMQIAEVGLLGSTLPADITQPGDPIIASSANSPGSEGVANAIDNQPTKYLNRDSANDAKPSGFVVSPTIGRTVVTGITLESANDAADRDPKKVTLEGSNDDAVTDFNSGNWTTIVTLDVPSWPSVFGPTDAENRYKTQIFLFDNYTPYKHYRWTVLNTQGPSTCCMQIAEVELLGTGAPQDVTLPGDPVIASSANSPGSEGVANAIDNQPTKYLNRDSANDAKPSGFVVTPSVGATTIIGITMESANDAADRDPKKVTVEGSNDETITDFNSGSWETIATIDVPSWQSVFGPTDAENRYKTQEFYFPNKKSYLHYRWTVLNTQGPSTCCMQIAEVEFLAISQGADCSKARFLVQPVDTPVLSGAQATFFTSVNGPWPLQWYKNGTPIPGATKTTYTTDPVTAENASDVYSVEIVGCEMSAQVKAVIFTPSSTKSIGISFQGGGANGTPTLMKTNDIAGLQPQAYWNNAQNAGTGTFPYDVTDPNTGEVTTYNLMDSDNRVSDITFEFATSGAWGSGTGDASATQRMLNGLNHAQPGTPGTLTFGSVPAGKHSVIAYMVGIPLQFQDADYTVAGQSSQTAYVRVINSDEYNLAPGFYRGVSTDPNNRDLATYVRFDDVTPAADGTIVLTWNTITTGFDRGAPVNAIQLILNSTPAGAPPAITQNPQPTVAPAGGTARLTVTATGDNLTYQWRKNGKNLPNGGNISGATTATLTISSFSEADVGVYNVAVFNPGGSVISRTVAAHLSKYDITDALVGYWKLDETSGTTAANSATGGQPGTVNGTASWQAGRIANAFNFDSFSYIQVPSYPVAKDAISAAAWVNAPANSFFSDVEFIRNAQGGLGLGVGQNGFPAGQFELGLAYDANTGDLRLSGAITAGPNVVRATAPTTFPFGSWHHVAFSADGAQLRLYLDGAEVAVRDYLSDINAPEIPYLTIGARLNDDGTGTIGLDAAAPNTMMGPVDDVGLWTRVLTADEVKAIYDLGKTGKPLTDVVEEPPVSEPGTLNVSLSGGNVTVTWDKGTLQTAPAVTGPWTDAAGASPVTEPASGTAKFYRTVSQ